jgi:hypothetical protein
MKLRSVFSACSARSSHWCCSCSNRISLWSPDLQPHPPPLHICALTAEDILFEHSFKATGADCYSYRDGTAFSAVARAFIASTEPPAHRFSILTLRPSVHPNACYCLPGSV